MFHPVIKNENGVYNQDFINDWNHIVDPAIRKIFDELEQKYDRVLICHMISNSASEFRARGDINESIKITQEKRNARNTETNT